MPDTHIEFRYTVADVVSAQRLRFLRSIQFKIILLVWLASLVFFSAPLLLPRWLKPAPYMSWGLVVQVMLAYAVTLLVLIFITPLADFFINRFWRLPLTLQFNEKQLHISVTGKTGGLHLKWSQVRQVDEDSRAFILHYGPGGSFVIIPKTAFTRPADDRRFRDLLSRRAQIQE